VKIFLDEDVNVLIAAILRSHGIKALTTQEANRKRCGDRDQLKFAAENEYVFVTHNRDDFAALAVEWFEAGRPHAGIISVVRRPPSVVAKRLLGLLVKSNAEGLKNQFLIL
jgi:predicted nuclease of predicted toxin-antitoxin system